MKVKRLLVIGSESRFGQQIVDGIYAYGRLRGQWEYHQEVYRGALTFQRCRFALESWKIDGVIAQFRTRAVESLVRKLGLPGVNFSGAIDTRYPTVAIDSMAAGSMAAEHLLENGGTNFGFCALTNEAYTARQLAGFQKTLKHAGFDCAVFTDHFVGDDEVNWAQNRRRMDRWLLSLPKPVAMLCIHDLRGQEVLWACRRLGLRVPDDVAIVGMGNDEFTCRTCNPPLSSVDIHAERIGYEAARLLDRLLRGGKPPTAPIFIPPRRLVARQSSDVIAVDDPEVAAAIRFIRQRAYEPISVTDLLDAVPISRRALERRFEKAIGRMPKREIMRRRIARAKELLDETELGITTIALESGFAAQDNFSAAFRRETGMTPTQYRRTVRPATGSLLQASTGNGRRAASYGRPGVKLARQ